RREPGAGVVEPPHALGVGDREELAVQVGVVVDLEVPLPADEERLALGEVEPLPTELHLHRHCCRPYPQACSNCDRTPRSLTAATSIQDRKSTRLNSSHVSISYAVFCLKKK